MLSYTGRGHAYFGKRHCFSAIANIVQAIWLSTKQGATAQLDFSTAAIDPERTAAGAVMPARRGKPAADQDQGFFARP